VPALICSVFSIHQTRFRVAFSTSTMHVNKKVYFRLTILETTREETVSNAKVGCAKDAAEFDSLYARKSKYVDGVNLDPRRLLSCESDMTFFNR
jgi:hypothetical protein